MKWALKITVWVFLASLLVYSCRKPENYSVIPEIEYMSFSIRDTTDLLGNKGLVGELKFSFVDGDGDIGLRQPADSVDPEDPDNTDLFFTMYVMKNGILTELDEDDLQFPLNYRIPYLEPEGQDPSLKGEIQVEFLYLLFEYDTIQYDFYITDRALNESNIESTPLMVLPDVNF
ncbi:MAG: hypothetical protein QNK30_08405 [Bacteroidales bacterium]|nr:hypothetical protein [Bacteroidales bacterium]